MPENPLLDADVDGRYHARGLSERARAVVEEVAARHGVAVVDGRRWMPADAFFDLVHLFPDVGGFERLLTDVIHAALADAT
jgi:hypothetical protein